MDLLVRLCHSTEEGSNLLRAEAGAAWLQVELDADRYDQMAPDLDGPGAPRGGRQGAGPLLLQEFSDSLQGQSDQLPLSHQQKLLDVALCVVRTLADAVWAINQPGLDEAPDRATGQLCKGSEVIEREGL